MHTPPPRHKMALLTWPGAWALITLLLWVLGPLMATWPLLLRTFVLSVLMVLGLSWVVIPHLTRLFSGWLAQNPPAARHRPARRLSLNS
jgi:antibiotic biosynthesis monooxygenase (ABM) superfamily enzyme